jgi:hypothetical protein
VSEYDFWVDMYTIQMNLSSTNNDDYESYKGDFLNDLVVFYWKTNDFENDFVRFK